MRKTAPPATLHDSALDFARREFLNRQKELQSMKSSLVLLEEVMPELAARGVAPHVGNLRWNAFGRKICIFCSDTRAPAKLREALLDLGFAEDSRTDYSTFFHVDLKKGRLKVHMTVYTEKAAA